VVTAWILSLLLVVVPPGRVPARESEADGRARYAEIAADIAAAVADEAPLFAGQFGRERTAALLVSVALFESGFRVDVDRGVTLGDHGASCTLWQLNLGRGRIDGFSCGELAANRRKAAALALRAMRRSRAACPNLPIEDMLRVYASGSCERGARESAERVRFAQRLFARHPPHQEAK
jgi:hypothetical protein